MHLEQQSSDPSMNRGSTSAEVFRSRNRNDWILLEFRPDKPLLKVVQRRTSHLEKMGIARKDGHFLAPEEAVYLAEIGAAAILVDGKPLPLTHIYSILHHHRVSPLKYAAFARLTKAGYILRLPTSTKSDDHRLETNAAATDAAFTFPNELLAQFPGISRNGDQISIPEVTCPKEGLLGDTELSAAVDAQMCQRMLRDWKKLGGDARKGHEPWNPCRPRHWPPFYSLRNATSWKCYEDARAKLLAQGRPSSSAMYTRAPSHDYDVCSSPNEVLYRLLVIDDRQGFRMPSTEQLQKLAVSADNRTLLLVTGDHYNVRFTKCTASAENQHLAQEELRL